MSFLFFLSLKDVVCTQMLPRGFRNRIFKSVYIILWENAYRVIFLIRSYISCMHISLECSCSYNTYTKRFLNSFNRLWINLLKEKWIDTKAKMKYFLFLKHSYLKHVYQYASLLHKIHVVTQMFCVLHLLYQDVPNECNT